MEGNKIIWSKLYKIDKEVINSIVPSNINGVYRLSYKKDEEYFVFYVNTSNDIKSSLLNHLDESKNICIQIHLKNICAFRYAQIDDENLRNATNRKVFTHYQPSCNDKIPDGNDEINVNLT